MSCERDQRVARQVEVDRARFGRANQSPGVLISERFQCYRPARRSYSASSVITWRIGVPFVSSSEGGRKKETGRLGGGGPDDFGCALTFGLGTRKIRMEM